MPVITIARIEITLSYAALAMEFACANLHADVVTLTNLNDDFTSREWRMHLNLYGIRIGQYKIIGNVTNRPFFRLEPMSQQAKYIRLSQ
jgi:hypothetical protein